MELCKDCLSEKVCRYNDSCKDDCDCPHFKSKSGFAEVKHAEWKYDFSDYPSRYDVHIICTNCGHMFARLTGVNFNYCPNCGAKMDGGKNV